MPGAFNQYNNDSEIKLKVKRLFGFEIEKVKTVSPTKRDLNKRL